MAKTILEQVIDACAKTIRNAPKGKKPWIILPTIDPKDTKLNRIRFNMTDRKSPMGIIVRGDSDVDLMFETAAARFDAAELLPYLIRYVAEIRARQEATPEEPA